MTACGGGGGTNTYYPYIGGSCATGYTGYSYTCTPNVGNLPPGSTPNITATNVPPGLTMNSATGALTGIPTAPGYYAMNLTLTASGATGVVNFPLSIQIAAPAPNAWAVVDASTPFPRFASQAAAVIGSNLYLVGSREDNLAIETWLSGDLGVTWSKLSVTPSLAAKDFALASDGTHVLLTGGRDAANQSNNLAFIFDETAWQSVPATGTTYSARWGHTLTAWNGAWWIVGGTNGSSAGANAMADVWKSLDNGASWSLTTNNLGATAGNGYGVYAPTYGHCVGIINNHLVKAGGSNSLNALDRTGLITIDSVRLWQSSDGANWTISTATSQQAFTHAGCATVNGLLHYIGGTRMNAQDSPVSLLYASTMWTFDGNVTLGTISDLTDSTPTLFDGSLAFSQRFGAATAVMGSKLFLIGGRSSMTSGTAYSDVWVSTR